jgi:hypothetical protein
VAEFHPQWVAAVESDEAFAQRFAEARQRGEQRLQADPRAVSASFDPVHRRFTLSLQNGLSLTFPAEALHELTGATDEELAGVCMPGFGFALEWPSRDMHISVAGLLIDLMGEAWLREVRTELNRRIARSKSAARTQAARENGKKGGRPKKKRSA